jgi:hypothetical protein
MRAVVLAGLLALAWPASAQAVDMGGGTAPTSFAGYRDELTIVRLTPNPDQTVTVRLWVQARCGGGEFKKRVVPLAADGAFSYAETVRGRLPEDRRVRRIARLAIAGRVLAASATGTAGVRLKFRRGGRVVDRCRSGTRTGQARPLPPFNGPDGAPRPNGAYYGLTTQPRRPHAFMLHVNRSATRVQAAAFNYLLFCRPGRKVWISRDNLTPGGRIVNGRFALGERFLLRFSNGSERYRVKISGRFTAAGVEGSISVTMIGKSRSGAVTDRCETGRQGFGAVL